MMSRTVGLAAVALAGMAVLSGCPGRLSEPARFKLDAAGGDSPTSQLCKLGINVETEIFVKKCGSSACHGNIPMPGGNLNMVAPGLAARLIGIPSSMCMGKVLVNRQAPAAGFFLEKLAPGPACGQRMPLIGLALTADEVECVRLWVEQALMSFDGGVPDASKPADAATDGPRDGGGGAEPAREIPRESTEAPREAGGDALGDRPRDGGPG